MSATIRQVTIRGRVQGVGFRYWVEQEAMACGLEGWVRNRRGGSVEALFAGPADVVSEMIAVKPARSAIGAGRSCPGRARQFGCAEFAAAGRAVFGIADDIGSMAVGHCLPDSPPECLPIN